MIKKSQCPECGCTYAYLDDDPPKECPICGVVFGEKVEEEKTEQYASESLPVVKRVTCNYCNAGICTYDSTSIHLVHCNYVNRPTSCGTALLSPAKFLHYEFY